MTQPTRACGRKAGHRPHLWLLARQALKCPGVAEIVQQCTSEAAHTAHVWASEGRLFACIGYVGRSGVEVEGSTPTELRGEHGPELPTPPANRYVMRFDDSGGFASSDPNWNEAYERGVSEGRRQAAADLRAHATERQKFLDEFPHTDPTRQAFAVHAIEMYKLSADLAEGGRG